MKLKLERVSFYDEVYTETAFKEGNTNVLIIGDSHSRDLYLSFYLNKDSYEDYSFERIPLNAVKAKSSIDFLDSTFVKKSDIVIICYRVSKKTWVLDDMEEFIDSLKIRNKRVVISLNIDEFYSFGRREVFDEFILNNAADSQTFDIDSMQKFFYENRRTDIEIINDSIMNYAKRKNIEYLDRYSMVCDDETKSCFGITPEGKKAYGDGSHLSLDGAKFFGNKLRENGSLIKTNFVPKNFNTSKSKLNQNVKDIRFKIEKEIKGIYKEKTEIKLKLQDKTISPKERKKLKKDMADVKRRLKEIKQREKLN